MNFCITHFNLNYFGKLLTDPAKEKELVLWTFSLAAGFALLNIWLPHFLVGLTLEYLAQRSPMWLETSSSLTYEAYLKSTREMATIVFSVIGGFTVLVGLLLTQRRLDHNRAEHRTQQFKDAVELLGNEGMDVRQGAIYALQSLMRDNPQQYGITICSLLASYINNHGGQITNKHIEETILCDEHEELSEQYPTNSSESEQLLSEIKKIQQDISKLKPYADVRAALQVLRARRLPAELEMQINFNLDKIHWGHFIGAENDLTPIDIYKGDYSEQELKQLPSRTSGKSYVGSNFNDAVLKNIDFSNADLTKAFIHNSIIEEIKAKKTNLYHLHLDKNCYLKNIGASNIIAWCISIKHTQLNSVVLKDITIKNSYLKTGSSLTLATVSNISILNSALENVQIAESTFNGGSISDSPVLGSALFMCNIKNFSFSEDLISTKKQELFKNTRFEYSDFSNCIFHFIRLTAANFEVCKFERCFFRGAVFNNCTLHRLEFLDAFELEETKFINCDLKETVFNSNFSLNNVSFEECRFTNCCFETHFFLKASLQKVHFQQCDLSAIEITQHWFSNFTWDAETTFPNGKKYDCCPIEQRPEGWVPEEITEKISNK